MKPIYNALLILLSVLVTACSNTATKPNVWLELRIDDRLILSKNLPLEDGGTLHHKENNQYEITMVDVTESHPKYATLPEDIQKMIQDGFKLYDSTLCFWQNYDDSLPENECATFDHITSVEPEIVSSKKMGCCTAAGIAEDHLLHGASYIEVSLKFPKAIESKP